MKISLIFGVIHMTFGVLLSVWNKVNHRHYHSIILEFLPQVGVDHDHHDQPGDYHDGHDKPGEVGDDHDKIL